mmetsp:Transcript_28057/g.47181  ORF Transcript_28057/g.47181 Transcript_28057/m.47181 type:complete len:318 (-) Transcript_28057:1526-2479(-)
MVLQMKEKTIHRSKQRHSGGHLRTCRALKRFLSIVAVAVLSHQQRQRGHQSAVFLWRCTPYMHDSILGSANDVFAVSAETRFDLHAFIVQALILVHHRVIVQSTQTNTVVVRRHEQLCLRSLRTTGSRTRATFSAPLAPNCMVHIGGSRGRSRGSSSSGGRGKTEYAMVTTSFSLGGTGGSGSPASSVASHCRRQLWAVAHTSHFHTMFIFSTMISAGHLGFVSQLVKVNEVIKEDFPLNQPTGYRLAIWTEANRCYRICCLRPLLHDSVRNYIPHSQLSIKATRDVVPIVSGVKLHRRYDIWVSEILQPFGSRNVP